LYNSNLTTYLVSFNFIKYKNPTKSVAPRMVKMVGKEKYARMPPARSGAIIYESGTAVL